MTPAEDYQFLTEKCCGKCGHLHGKHEACNLLPRCPSCGFPTGVATGECQNCRKAER